MESSISERRARGAGWFSRAIVLGIVVGVGAGSARAEPAASTAMPASVPAKETAREAARARLVDGVELLRQKQFAAALAKFDQAYALVPSPNIDYDRGLAYVGLGRDADALEAFDGFLARADHPPPGTREKALRDRETLRARVATLAVTSDPPGAEVVVDGRIRGTTPFGGPVYLDPGPHQVAARNAATGATAAERIVAAPRETVHLTLRLGAAEANAAVASQAPVRALATGAVPPGAEVRATSGAAERHAGPSTDLGMWSALGIGVALLGAGATFGILAQHESDSLARDSQMGAPPKLPVNYQQQKQSNGLRDQTLEEVFLSVGAAAVTTGIIFYSIRYQRQHRESHLNGANSPPGSSVTFGGDASLSPRFAGARLRLTF